MGLGHDLGIDVLSSAFDLESLAMLTRLGMTTLKVPSGEITDLPYLRAIAAATSGGKGKVILSTGMADFSEVGAALDVLAQGGVGPDDVTLLHCTTEYPAPPDHVNLRAMAVMGESFGVATGYSDHTLGIAIPVAAAALGARIIEKHLTLNRQLPGPDHHASLEPEDFSRMVDAIRTVEAALGSTEKRPAPSEEETRYLVRKSIVALTSIRAGDLLSSANLTTKRPGTGISPMRWDHVVGTHAVRDFASDEEIEI
jgi:sialic acid synthase SpsE